MLSCYARDEVLYSESLSCRQCFDIELGEFRELGEKDILI